MSQKFLKNFLYKRILLFYDSMHPKDSYIMIKFDNILIYSKIKLLQ